MVVLVLLVAALIVLIVGVVEASAVWLVISLAVSLIAGLLLFGSHRRYRATISGRTSTGSTVSGKTAPPPPVDGGAEQTDDGPRGEVGAPSSLGGHQRPRAVDATADSAAAEHEDDVWVIDGRPRYHRQSCEFVHDQDSERVPLSQAAEDGFIPCSLCEPDAVRTA
jgi:hypothetical protein